MANVHSSRSLSQSSGIERRKQAISLRALQYRLLWGHIGSTSQTRKGLQRLEFDVRSKLNSEIGVRVALRGGGTADAIMSERMSSSRR